MQITKINHKGKKYEVFFDNQESLVLHESVIIKHSLLKPKITVTTEELSLILADNDFYLALDCAFKYLHNLHSKKQVEKHLSEKFSSNICKRVIEELDRLHLIDEKAYAEAFLSYCIHQKKGYEYVKRKLSSEEIVDEIIADILQDYSWEKEAELCESVFLKQINTYKKSTCQEARDKVTNYLLNRGFRLKVITFTLEKNAELIDNIINEEELFDNLFERYFNMYSKKASGKELEWKLIRGLSAKGFKIEQIKSSLEKRKVNND